MWGVILIIGREFIISGFRLIAADNGVVIAASYWGKFKTTFQMIMVIVLLLNFDHIIFYMIENKYSFTDQEFQIKVNGTALTYGEVTMHNVIPKEYIPCQDFLVSQTVSLNQGKNTIELVVNNDFAHFQAAS